MVKKTVILAMTIAVFTGSFSGCGNNTKTIEESAANAGGFSKELVIKASKADDTTNEKLEDLQAKILKEKFNIVLKWENYSSNDWNTKMDLLFASQQEPEYFNQIRQDQRGAEWAAAGYLKPFSTDELNNMLPNYMKSWTKDGWDEAYLNMKAADDKLYYLPSQRPDTVAQSWVYRKDVFDELGLSFPKTTDELYNVMKTYKDKTGKIAIPNGAVDLWAVSWAFMAFGMPELILRDLSYVDTLTNEFVPYAMADDKKVRPMVIYLNKLYEDGLLWKESFVATKQQITALQSKGEGMMMWGYPASIPAYNSTYMNVAPKVDWQWAKDMITADSSRGTVFKKEPSYKAWGPAFSAKISDEKRERMIKFLDWASTEEGKNFFNFGVEGVTYEMKNGEPTLLSNMQKPDNPKGRTLGQYGIQEQFIFTHKGRNDKYGGGLVNTLVANEFLNKKGYYSFLNPPLVYTEIESKKLADPQTRVNDVRNEYLVRFIMGNLDPNNDKDWNSYKDSLNKVGLADVVKIRTDAYYRSIGKK
jgi:putative aldouronate transport system substrate-binding protein